MLNLLINHIVPRCLDGLVDGASLLHTLPRKNVFKCKKKDDKTRYNKKNLVITDRIQNWGLSELEPTEFVNVSLIFFYFW